MYKSNHTEYERIKLILQGFVTRPETRNSFSGPLIMARYSLALGLLGTS